MEEWCSNQSNCPIEYRQYHLHSFEDPTLKYITFKTKNFYYYSYFHDTLSIKAGTTHVYFNQFPRDSVKQDPFLSIMDMKIDWNNLDKLDEKYRLYSKFK